jgi:hypothetical protein
MHDVFPSYSREDHAEAYALADSLREQFLDGSQLGAGSWLWFPQMSAFRRTCT